MCVGGEGGAGGGAFRITCALLIQEVHLFCVELWGGGDLGKKKIKCSLQNT